MPVTVFSSENTTLTTDSAEQMYYDDDHIADITRKVKIYNSIVPIDRLRFWQIAPNQYRYKVWFTDGREWKQEIYFDDVNDRDPFIEFNIGPHLFRSTEVLYNTEIRSSLYECRTKHGLTSWDMTFP
jgi:hypothetical protein